MSTTPAKRCKATTKKGTPCTRVPWRELDVCLAHAPATVRESRGFVARNGRAGRKPMPKPDAMMRQLMADEFMRLHGAHFRTMGYGIHVDESGVASLYDLPEGGARLHGTSQRDGSITMSDYDDLDAQRRAANDLLDRHFGRPKQAVALTGENGGPVLLRLGELLTPETARLASELAGRLAIESAREEGS